MMKRFFIYGIIGWSMEVLWTGVGSLLSGDLRLLGYSNVWMFFIYGSAVFLESIHDIIYKWKWPVRGFLWMIIIWGIEYSSGLLLLSLLGVYPWRYGGAYAVDGIITLAFAPAWFTAGLFFERVHRALDAYGV